MSFDSMNLTVADRLARHPRFDGLRDLLFR
jgi:hypothetical protein